MIRRSGEHGIFILGLDGYARDRNVKGNVYINQRSPLLVTIVSLTSATIYNEQTQLLPKQPPNHKNTTITMESAKQAVNYVTETVQGTLSGASKEANKEVAKDNNVDVGTR